MKRFRSILALILALVMILALCACGTKTEAPTNKPSGDNPATNAPGGDEPAPDDKPQDGANTSVGEKNLSPTTYDMYAQPAEPIEPTLTIDVGYTQNLGSTYNPQGAQGTTVPTMLLNEVYDYLFMYDGDAGNDFYSYILEEWHQEDDTTFVMTIRDGAYFCTKDGKYADVTGEDILFSLKAYVDNFSNFSAHFLPYNYDASYVSDDGRTVYLKSDEPYGPMLRTIPIICKKWVEENGWDSELWASDPCGSGPYTAGEFVSGSKVSCVIRDDYWNKEYRQTPVKEYVVHMYTEVSTMYIDLEMGKLDIALGLDSQDYDRCIAEKPENLAVETYHSAVLWQLGLGGGDCEALADPVVREAIAYAVDWNAVGEACFGSMYAPAYGCVSPNSPYFTEGLVPGYTFDQDHARQILADAGYKDGDIVFNNVNFGKQAKVAEAVQAYLSQVGITMEVETFEFLTTLQSWMGVGEPICDTAFNDQTDATGEPTDNMGHYSARTEAAFPCLICTDETWNNLYWDLLHSKSDRQAKCDEVVKYVFDNYCFIAVALCYESYGYNTSVIRDANFANAEYGPDLSLCDFVY